MPRTMRPRGFTLIELLVVIAIIALLIGILLPALANARQAAWQALSRSNVRQITAGAHVYREDARGYLPWTLSYPRGTGQQPPFPTGGRGNGSWCTWSYGGKNNGHTDGYWRVTYGGIFDHEAADRPLNSYLYPNVEIYAPPIPANLQNTDPTRNSLQLEVFRDPSDKISYQRAGSNFRTNPELGPFPPSGGSYDDVGTSYHTNMKWWDQLVLNNISFPSDPTFPAGVMGLSASEKRFRFGMDRFRIADSFQPSRMVWLNDQFADAVIYNNSTMFRLRNGYREFNKSVMGFLDGHVGYLPVYPGSQAKSFKNELYTLVFEDLRAPGN